MFHPCVCVYAHKGSQVDHRLFDCLAQFFKSASDNINTRRCQITLLSLRYLCPPRPCQLSPRQISQDVLRLKTLQWKRTTARRPRANRNQRSSHTSRRRKTQQHSSHRGSTLNPKPASTSPSKHTRSSFPRTRPGSLSIQYTHSK